MKHFQKLALLIALLCTFAACSPAVTSDTPDTPDEPKQPTTDTPSDPVDTPVPDNVLLDENATANQGVLPRGIDQDSAWVKDAKGAELVMYYADEDVAFSYTDADKNIVTDSVWLRKLSAEYDIRLYMVRKNPATSLAAQRIAMLSGAQLDILSFTPDQLPFASGMTADLGALSEDGGTDFLNQALLRYGNSSARYLMPAGVARTLWYAEGGKTDPYALFTQNKWNFSAFSSFITDGVQHTEGKITRYGFEIGEISDLLTALGDPAVQFTDGAFIQNNVGDSLHALQGLFGEQGVYCSGREKDAPSLLAGDLMMRYGSTPFVRVADKYPAVSWAPLPVQDGAETQNAVIASVPILALPADSAHPKAALGAALLFTARFADAHHDRLRFTYGLAYQKWRALYEYANEQIRISFLPDDETRAAFSVWMRDAGTDIDSRYPNVADALDAYLREQNFRLAP